MRIIGLSLVYFCLLFSKLSAKNWFSEYWQQFSWKAYESDHFDAKTFLRIETGNHMKNTRALLLSEQFVYKVNKDVSLGANYSYIHGHPLTDPTWRWQHRLELEVYKIFRLPWNFQIITRNRLEIRWRQNQIRNPDSRYRLRAMFLFPLKDVKPLKAFSFFNEVIFIFSRDFFEQARICPCQLTFEITKKIDLDIFFMIRLIDENNTLIKSALLGTQLSF